jgi:hypothetical protein
MKLAILYWNMNLLKHQQTYYDIYKAEHYSISNPLRTLMRSGVDEYFLLVIDDDLSMITSELLHENISFSLDDTLKEYEY